MASFINALRQTFDDWRRSETVISQELLFWPLIDCAIRTDGVVD